MANAAMGYLSIMAPVANVAIRLFDDPYSVSSHSPKSVLGTPNPHSGQKKLAHAL
jgi:hypothetical protein